ncbi:MAG: hypothetical protein KGL39_40485 [Patescibacteria group bacterium]|nr:hypothetical protein [Patescibacteria group bacterium]
MMGAVVKLDLNVPPPERRPNGRKRDWDQVPVGASFEFDESPGAVLSSFSAYLARGKYRIERQPNGRHRFWRLG